eukprot:16416265-Heterocapsa_arctica.AAC.1
MSWYPEDAREDEETCVMVVRRSPGDMSVVPSAVGAVSPGVDRLLLALWHMPPSFAPGWFPVCLR